MKFSKSLKSVVMLIFCFAVILCGIGHFNTAAALDWPHWRGPDYNGISKETGWSANWPEAGPKILWEASLGTGFSSMSVSNGRIYTMGNIDANDIVYCFDAATGDEIWKKSYPCPLFDNLHEGGPCATPTVDGDAVYTFSKKGDIIRFEAATGQIVWQENLQEKLGLKPPMWNFSSSPFIAGDLVILNAGLKGVALNKADGSIKWQSGAGPGAYSTPVPFKLGDKDYIAMFVAKEEVALEPTTGTVLWSIPWKTQADINASDAIISGDKIFISSGYNVGCGLFKIGAGEPQEIYRNKNMSNQLNSCVLWKGHLYGFDGMIGMGGKPGRGKLTCMEFDTAQVKWTKEGLGTGSVMLADGKLIVLSEDGKLVIAEASPEGYKELASAQILTYKCWTVPVLANGRIYARNTAGRLVCVDVSGKSWAVSNKR
jgi:outer membrane protein assembly factor BamB